MRTLALFDFDGTITRGDSLLIFLQHMVGVRAAALGAPSVLRHWVKLLLRANLSHSTAKETLLKVHMRNRSREEWDKAVRTFHAGLNGDYYNQAVLDRLRAYQQEGATVAIVSASIDIWLQPFAEALKTDLICTRSKWDRDVWVGFEGSNCRGNEKVRRVQQAYDLAAYNHVVAFGNTGSDYAMLNLADESWLVSRKGRLLNWEKPKQRAR